MVGAVWVGHLNVPIIQLLAAPGHVWRIPKGNWHFAAAAAAAAAGSEDSVSANTSGPGMVQLWGPAQRRGAVLVTHFGGDPFLG